MDDNLFDFDDLDLDDLDLDFDLGDLDDEGSQVVEFAPNISPERAVRDPETRLRHVFELLAPKDLDFKTFVSDFESSEDALTHSYKLLRLPPSNQGLAHHANLVKVFCQGMVVCEVSPDVESPVFLSFREHLISIYQNEKYDYQTAVTQVDLVIKKFIIKGEFIPPDPEGISQEKVKNRATYKDILANLMRFDEVSPFDLIPFSPLSDPHRRDPLFLVRHLFNDETLTQPDWQPDKRKTRSGQSPPMGYMATSQFATEAATLLIPGKAKVEGMERSKFICYSVFKDRTNRKKENLLHTPYLVAECDMPNYRTQRRFIGMVKAMIDDRIPIVKVTYSGGKSFHVWFNIMSWSKEHILALGQLLIFFGADPAVINNKVSLVRTPNAIPTEKEASQGKLKQTCFYFNPDMCKGLHDDDLMSSDSVMQRLEDMLREARRTDIHAIEGKFIYQDGTGDWILGDRTCVRNHLVGQGFRDYKIGIEMRSPVDNEIEWIEKRRRAHAFIKQVAGHQPGPMPQEIPNSELIADEKPVIVGTHVKELKPMTKKDEGYGEFDAIRKAGQWIFPGENWKYFEYALAGFVQGLWNKGKGIANFGKPTQYICIVGEGNSGKSLFIDTVVSGMLRGSVDPSNLFKGNQFVEDTVSKYLLFSDDSDVFTDDINFRHHQGEIVKQIVVASNRSIEVKFGDRFTIKSYNLLMRVLNPSKIHTLPFIDDPSVEDKIIILKSTDKPFNQYCKPEKFKADVAPQLRAYYTYLIHLEIPEEYRDPGGRYYVNSYKDPNIARQLLMNSPKGIATRFMKQFCTQKFEGECEALHSHLLKLCNSNNSLDPLVKQFRAIFKTPDIFEIVLVRIDEPWLTRSEDGLVYTVNINKEGDNEEEKNISKELGLFDFEL